LLLLQVGGDFHQQCVTALDCASPVERSAPDMAGLRPLLRQIRSAMAS
jgi:hypothetical protein